MNHAQRVTGEVVARVLRYDRKRSQQRTTLQASLSSKCGAHFGSPLQCRNVTHHVFHVLDKQPRASTPARSKDPLDSKDRRM